jgi:hypothetical protein
VATLADIARATGAKPRSIQLWADAGVLLAEAGTDREGSGQHREFSKQEVVIACIVAPFANEKVAVGGLKAIATGVRNVMAFGHPFEMQPIHDALAGKGENFITIATFPSEGRTAYAVTTIGNQYSSKSLMAFLSEMTMGGAKLNVLSLNTLLKPIRVLYD